MTARVLVTGGAGYIGSVIVDQLLERDFGVVVLDDLSTGHRAAVASGAIFVQGNVGDGALVASLLERERIEAIVHMAAFALVPESVAQPEKYRANNVTAAEVMLDAAARAGVGRFVFSSSCAVYGHPAEIPIRDDADLNPVNPYGETKRDFERILSRRARLDGFAAMSLRYFNAAGATEQRGEDHHPETHLIPNVLGVALGRKPAVDVFGTDYPTADGTAVRDYVHVADIADAHVRALDVLDGGEGKNVALNLGTGAGHSVREMIEAARRITGRPLATVERPRRPGDPPALVAQASHTVAVLGWRPRRSSLDEILESAWRWHQAHPHGYRS